jgi:hypothetical protein
LTIIFSFGTFEGSEESALLDELLSAYNDGDEEAATLFDFYLQHYPYI